MPSSVFVVDGGANYSYLKLPDLVSAESLVVKRFGSYLLDKVRDGDKRAVVCNKNT